MSKAIDVGKAIDLTGQQFGSWTVLRRVRRRGYGRTFWRVRCACGLEATVAAGSLRAGKSTQCRVCAARGRHVYKAGDVVGSWTVLGHAPRGRGYVVRCACGFESRRGSVVLDAGGGCQRCRLRRTWPDAAIKPARNASGWKLAYVGASVNGRTILRVVRRDAANVQVVVHCATCGKISTTIDYAFLTRGCKTCWGLARREVTPESPHGAAARVPGAVRGTCSWCGRGTQRKPYECSACDRTSVRNGRDEDGRPIRKAPVPDPSGTCKRCGCYVGERRARRATYCAPCYRLNNNEKRREASRLERAS